MAFNKRIICFALCLLLFAACMNNTTTTIGKSNVYRTEIKVHYSTYNHETYTFYTENKTDVCSFNGTNYLIEKGNTEELFSTTAPIEIIKQSKFDENGKETECEANYYRGSN